MTQRSPRAFQAHIGHLQGRSAIGAHLQGLLRCLIQEPYRQPSRNLFRRYTFSRAGSGASANGIGRRDRAGIGRLIRQPTDRDGRVSAGTRESS